MNPSPPKGLLVIDKPRGKTSFSLVARLRRLLGVQKIGHAGTLDPFATGVMVLLVGREWTRQAMTLQADDKVYETVLRLGQITDSYDCEGQIIESSEKVPTAEEIDVALQRFQGEILQVPPMYSAKKIGGKRLYLLARKGVEIERPAVEVKVAVTFVRYEYPFLSLRVECSKGTYIRSLGHDIGQLLGCGAHLVELRRLRSGRFDLSQAISGEDLFRPDFDSNNLCLRNS